MDKEKLSHKRSSNLRDSLPEAPPDPQLAAPKASPSQSSDSDAFKRLIGYEDREKEFLKTLEDVIEMDCNRLRGESDNSGDNSEILDNDKTTECEWLREECESFINPLLKRTGPAISAALVSHDAFEQLNRLHGLLDQFMTFQEQNYQMKRKMRDVVMLGELKKLQKKESNELLQEEELSETELDLDNQSSLLSTILAAGNSASTKRNSSKRQRERSKSFIVDDAETFITPIPMAVSTMQKEHKSGSQLRRQSAFTDSTKAKVSKWTKVKAAFKWERANVPVLYEAKSPDSGIGLTPINDEVARYLCVPSVPCTGSSVDSVLSSSSGHLLSGGSFPATPGTISSASSMEDVASGGAGGTQSEEMRRDSSKSDSRCDSRTNEEDTRRSRSLDGDSIVGANSSQGKSKTPWKKVKDIIQTSRGSFKNKPRSRSTKSSGSITESREVSPCDSLDASSSNQAEDRSEILTSSQTSSLRKSSAGLSISVSSQDVPSGHVSPGSTGYKDDFDQKSISKGAPKTSRKSRILSDFESLPEDVIVDLKTHYHKGKPPPSPLNLRDSSDADIGDLSYSPTLRGPGKFAKPKRSLISGNSSVPSSPSRHSEFFAEFESEDLSSGDFSEPCTPHRKLSPKTSLQNQQEEINEKYIELKDRLNQEFESKRQEWDKIRSASNSNSSAYQLISKDEMTTQSNKNLPAKMLEENLSADFRKKLHKWRVKKQTSAGNILKDNQVSSAKDTEPKKIDWNLWKTGQLKLEGQGLTPLPDQKDLPEEFQKKLDEWKKMKETNTVPSYSSSQDSLRRLSGKLGQAKFEVLRRQKDDSDKEKRNDREKIKSHDKLEKLSKLKAMVVELPAKEIEVKTSDGVMKFEGISRKFTRKLYEWEKARGIGPESSTFALLHPGYRPLDVDNVAKENKSNKNSPTLGRSLSLDSISPHPSIPTISHQPSSLSLNDMDELKEPSAGNDRRICSNPELDTKENLEEPEAVIVEVEDDIVETAAPLFTAVPIVEHQTPVYKYELSSNQFCTGNIEPVLRQHRIRSERISSQALDDVRNLTPCDQEPSKDFKKNLKHMQNVLEAFKESLPELEGAVRADSPNVLDAFVIAKKLYREITSLLDQLYHDESCSPDDFIERSRILNSKIISLQKCASLLCRYTEMFSSQEESSSVPEISVTSDDTGSMRHHSFALVNSMPTVFQSQVMVNQATVKIDCTQSLEGPAEDAIKNTEHMEGSPIRVARNTSNGSKKKMRFRKMGSRQNSKTESSDSDDDPTNIVLETPRRLKRKTSRAKKLAEEAKKIEPKEEELNTPDDIVYVLKITPGEKNDQPSKDALHSPTETCAEVCGETSQLNLSNSASIFVKTKRKIFTTVEEPISESKRVIARDIETSSASDRSEQNGHEDGKSIKLVVKSLPPIPQSPTTQRRLDRTREPSPSIRSMIAKYNQKLDRSNHSPISSGSCSPINIRSPILERRVRTQTEKYEEKVERVVKSASAGNIRHAGFVAVEILDDPRSDDNTRKVAKSSSADAMPSNWKLDCTPKSFEHTDTDNSVTYPPSLACDSLLGIDKRTPIDSKEISPKSAEQQPKKEHLYRKNKEKPTTLFSKTGAIKKSVLKKGADNIYRRSMSSSAGEFWERNFSPDKSDNTYPKITRKHEQKSFAADQIYRRHIDEHFWHASASAPTTPLDDPSRPKTPLTERAMKLQRAKEDFLHGTILRCASNWDDLKEDVWKNRLSQMSMGGSESSVEEGLLAKSVSVGFIGTASLESPQTVSGFDSLPREVARSAKFASRFGLASLASKFRKVKMRRGSKDSTKLTAVSALCRQSLTVDVKLEEEEVSRRVSSSVDGSDSPNLGRTESRTPESQKKEVSKSSSLQTISFGTIFRRPEKDKMAKSKSTTVVLPELDDEEERK